MKSGRVVSAPSLHRESTDSLIYVGPVCLWLCLCAISIRLLVMYTSLIVPQIRAVLERSSIQPMLAGKHPLPLVELNFWSALYADLESIVDQVRIYTCIVLPFLAVHGTEAIMTI